MDIPATSKPLIDISEDIVTPNNSDSAVPSTIVQEFKSEDLEKRPDVASPIVDSSPVFNKPSALLPQKCPKSQTHACQTCGKTFLNKFRLLHHMKILHSETCRICGKIFWQKIDLMQHVKIHSKPDVASPIVGSSPAFNKPSALLPHPKSQTHPDVASPMVDSSPAFNKPSALLPRPESQTHTCRICGKIFSKKIGLMQHVKIHSKPDVASPIVDSSTVLNKPSALLPQKLPKSQTHACQTCGKTFLNEFRLLHHMKILHSESCRICGKIFWQKIDLMQHVKFHSKKFDEDIDVRQVTAIPASHIPLQISEAIVATSISDSAVGSTTNHESKLEDFEKTKFKEVIDDCQAMDISASHIPLQRISEASVTPNSTNSAVRSTTDYESNWEDSEKTKSEENIDDCQVMNVPVSHIPLQKILEVIVTPNNSDSLVSSTSNHEDIEEIVSILKDATEGCTQTDEFSTYSQYVDNKLKNYNDRTRAIVESCISNVLLRADFGEFDKPPFV